MVEEGSIESVDETEAEGAVKGREKQSVVVPFLWTTAIEFTQEGLAALSLLM